MLPFLTFRTHLNKVISIIIVSDFLVTTSGALLAPIFALFITQQIYGGSAEVVGFAIAIYWIVKSILQLFTARFIDKNHGELDDHYFMVGGLLLSGFVIGGYFFASEVWHVYILQALLGIGDSLLVPPFYAVFTRHVDKGNEGFEWSLRSSLSFGGGSALGGALGGILLAIAGFRNIFLLASILYFLSAIILIFLRPYVIPKTPKLVDRILAEQKRIY
ncbi:MAG: hypothetical protein G01um101429_878 [Parcubacteria group bacterium Gr01-1014_29]|nr:MAG: hypothetical protein G01um101429_878 [Parcubacteria group bacterium Gr01-1014_29]